MCSILNLNEQCERVKCIKPKKQLMIKLIETLLYNQP